MKSSIIPFIFIVAALSAFVDKDDCKCSTPIAFKSLTPVVNPCQIPDTISVSYKGNKGNVYLHSCEGEARFEIYDKQGAIIKKGNFTEAEKKSYRTIGIYDYDLDEYISDSLLVYKPLLVD